MFIQILNPQIQSLIQDIKNTPENKMSLCLKGKKLGKMRQADIIRIFSSIPKWMDELDLTYNQLDLKKGQELAEIVNNIPIHFDSLILDDNDLSKLACVDLIKLLAAIPSHIRFLSLSNNMLCKKTGDELEVIIGSIPEHVVRLDLSFNDLYKKTANELSQIFGAIHGQMQSLYLKFNKLGRSDGAYIAQAINDISQNRSNFRYSNLPNKTMNEIVLPFSFMPRSLTEFDLTLNYFETKILIQVIATLSTHLTSIKIDPEFINDDQFFAEILIVQILQLIATNRIEKVSFDNIIPLFEIDELRLNKLISILEEKKSSIAFLICGLLMEGKIENFIEEPDNPYAYMEKRTHDAISFYEKAAKLHTNESHVHLAQFILCELKTITKISSVNTRLASWDLRPPTSFVETADYWSYPNVKLPFFHPVGKLKPLEEKNDKLTSSYQVI